MEEGIYRNYRRRTFRARQSKRVGERNPKITKEVIDNRGGTRYLKKSTRHIFKVKQDKYRCVEELRKEHKVRRICRVIEVSESGYYKWRKIVRTIINSKDKGIDKKIKQIYENSQRIYGAPRITKELHKQGVRISKNTVAKKMKKQGIKSETKKKYKSTTNSRHNLPVATNKLNREFVAKQPNEKWTSDITYIWTNEGWIYLVVILDIYSRIVVNWRISKTLSKDFVIETIETSIKQRRPSKGLIFHSDRGVQYASNEVQELLKHNLIEQSMSRKGDCWDNAVTESFFHTLKTELIYRKNYKTREEAKNDIFEYIELFYNRKRLHSSINYFAPFDYELIFFIKFDILKIKY